MSHDSTVNSQPANEAPDPQAIVDGKLHLHGCVFCDARIDAARCAASAERRRSTPQATSEPRRMEPTDP